MKCDFCNYEEEEVMPVFNKGTQIGTEDDFSGKVVCMDCLGRRHDICVECGLDGAYELSDLESVGITFCKGHREEKRKALIEIELSDI